MSAVVHTGSSDARSACGMKRSSRCAWARTIRGAASPAAPAAADVSTVRRLIAMMPLPAGFVPAYGMSLARISRAELGESGGVRRSLSHSEFSSVSATAAEQPMPTPAPRPAGPAPPDSVGAWPSMPADRASRISANTAPRNESPREALGRLQPFARSPMSDCRGWKAVFGGGLCRRPLCAHGSRSVVMVHRSRAVRGTRATVSSPRWCFACYPTH